MAIRAFLNGKSFDPTTIEIMAAAFRDVCADLGLSDKRDVAWEVVAKRVIEVMKVERDPEKIRAAVLASFKTKAN
jgi:hypothetical protein